MPLAARRMPARGAVRAPETSSPVEMEASNGNPVEQAYRPNTEAEEQATLGTKTAIQAKRVLPSDHDTVTECTIARKTEERNKKETEHAKIGQSEPAALGTAEFSKENAKMRVRRQRLLSQSSQALASS